MIPPLWDLEKNYGDMLRGDIITDEDNNVYISSVTSSEDFPTVNGVDLTYNGGPADGLLLSWTPRFRR